MSRWPAALAAMRSSAYRWLWSTTLAGNSGRFAVMMVAGWLAFRLTHSPIGPGLTSFLAFAPALFVGPLAGALADRMDRRHLIRSGAIVGAAACFAAAGLAVAGRLGLPVVLMVALAAGVAVSLEQPARTALVSWVTSPQDRLNAFSLLRVPIQGSEMVGPAVATAVLARAGAAPALAVCGLFYVLAAVQAFRIEIPRGAPRSEPRSGGLLEDVREGLAYVRQDRVLGHLLLWVGLH